MTRLFQRGGALILCLCLLLGTLTLPARAETDVSYDVSVTANDGLGANLRQGPGARYDKVRAEPIPMHTPLHISKEDTAAGGSLWGYTEYTENGRTYRGWVALSEVTRAAGDNRPRDTIPSSSAAGDRPSGNTDGASASAGTSNTGTSTAGTQEVTGDAENPAGNTPGPTPAVPDEPAAPETSPELAIPEENVSAPGVEPGSFFDGVAYYGDRSRCIMGAKTANAYADLLEAQLSGGNGALCASLLDIADDGYPLLFAARRDETGAPTEAPKLYVRGDDGSFAPYDFSRDCAWGSVTRMSINTVEKAPALWATVTQTAAPEKVAGYLSYACEGGKLTLRHVIRIAQTKSEEGGDETVFTLDGAVTAPEQIEQQLGLSMRESLGRWDSEKRFNTDLSAGQTMIDALRFYAMNYTAYPHLPRWEGGDDGWRTAVTEIAGMSLRSGIRELYELGEGLYYAVSENDTAVLVQARRENGEVVLRAGQSFPLLPGEDEILRIAAEAAAQSNLMLDYGEIPGFDGVEALLSYVGLRLASIDGPDLNAPGRALLANYLETYLSYRHVDNLASGGTAASVDAEAVRALSEAAGAELEAINAFLTAQDITLNRPLTATVRLLWRSMDWSAPCDLTFAEGLSEALGDVALEVLFDNTQYFVRADAARLRALLSEYGSLTLRVTSAEGGGIGLVFFDGSGNILDKLDHSLLFSVSSSGETAAVVAGRGGYTDRIGGRYDSLNRSLLFETRHAGVYSVSAAEPELTDIDELSEQARRDIISLVAKGYLDANGGAFLPNASLTRYEFAQALALLLSALNRDAAVTLPDVPRYSPYYASVASVESEGLLAPAADGAFHGMDPITVEQALSSVALALQSHNDYTVPEEPLRCLTLLQDAGSITPEHVTGVALAVREGLCDAAGKLDPTAPMTRAAAAALFARALPLLYETPGMVLSLPPLPPSEDIPLDTGEGSVNPYAVIGVVSTVLALLGGIAAAAWYFLIYQTRPMTIPTPESIAAAKAAEAAKAQKAAKKASRAQTKAPAEQAPPEKPAGEKAAAQSAAAAENAAVASVAAAPAGGGTARPTEPVRPVRPAPKAAEPPPAQTPPPKAKHNDPVDLFDLD